MTSSYVIFAVLLALLHAHPLEQASLLFDPDSSSTFSNHIFTQYPEFTNEYQDGSSISGYTCEDVIQLGPASAKSIFGCADKSRSVGSWDFDGIVGLGLQNNAIPDNVPLFYSLCDTGSFAQCIFSVVLTEDGGEIQIGGYDNEAVNNSTLVFTPVISPCASCDMKSVYTIRAQHIRVENASDFGNRSRSTIWANLEDMVTVVDSGVSCTLLPTEVYSKKGFEVNVYKAVQHFINTNSTVYIKIGGQEFEIPLQGCFAPSTKPNVLTLGDTFFRGKVIVHDLSQRKRPRLGFAVQRAGYAPSSGGKVGSLQDLRKNMLEKRAKIVDSNKIILWKHTQNARKKRIDSVAVNTYDQNIYFTVLDVGTPRQSPFMVQIDTGSSFTAIFAQNHPSAPKWQVALLVVGIVVPVVGLGIGGLVFCNRKMRMRARLEGTELNERT